MHIQQFTIADSQGNFVAFQTSTKSIIAKKILGISADISTDLGLQWDGVHTCIGHILVNNNMHVFERASFDSTLKTVALQNMVCVGEIG